MLATSYVDNVQPICPERLQPSETESFANANPAKPHILYEEVVHIAETHGLKKNRNHI